MSEETEKNSLDEMVDALKETLDKMKFVIELCPGDVIRVGHVTVFVVGVRLQEFHPPNKGTSTNLSVHIAGAECEYNQNDWNWDSKHVMYDSPFLSFAANDSVVLIRSSPTKCSTIDRFMELRKDIQNRGHTFKGVLDSNAWPPLDEDEGTPEPEAKEP